ncbi:MAG: hypothetical protein CMA58_02470 [Euryarchaeota archaeon]|jgi:hypothetical protein|nr:hypothetical protein [Euryarchaeota archaeon]|tara:strand:- start:1083 stop:1313 length:231 start_codon:yes stop_codon:yes gene_type:complete
MIKCSFPECSNEGIKKSRLSVEGYLISSGKKAYSFREAYQQFQYCKEHHDKLMQEVWNRVKKTEQKDDDHVAPTSI